MCACSLPPDVTACVPCVVPRAVSGQARWRERSDAAVRVPVQLQVELLNVLDPDLNVKVLDRALNIVYCWLILLLLTLFRVRIRPKWLHKSLIFLRGGSGVAKAAFFMCLQGLIPQISSFTLSWSHVRSVSHCRPHESPQFSKCNGGVGPFG